MSDLLDIDLKKPWLKADGSKLSESELKSSSKFWSALQWECYLQTLEYEEDPNVIGIKSDKLIELAPRGELRDLLPDSTNLTNEVIDLIRLSLQSGFLTERDREVLHQVYWEGRTDSEIAELMRISLPLVKKIKIKTRLKVKRILEAYLALALRKKCAKGGIRKPYKGKGGRMKRLNLVLIMLKKVTSKVLKKIEADWEKSERIDRAIRKSREVAYRNGFPTRFL